MGLCVTSDASSGDEEDVKEELKQQIQSADDEKHSFLRLGDTAPNFTAETTFGKLDFYDFIGDSFYYYYNLKIFVENSFSLHPCCL